MAIYKKDLASSIAIHEELTGKYNALDISTFYLMLFINTIY
jgi:hypothetical protein